MKSQRGLVKLLPIVLAVLVAIVGYLLYNVVPWPCTFVCRSDAAPWHSNMTDQHEVYTRVRSYSLYLTMRDQVKIAIDVHLPESVSEPIPAILLGTRYLRNIALKPPFNLFMTHFNVRRGLFIDPLVKRGYAFLVFDVRGTGASGGFRKYDLHDDEIDDVTEIIDWVIKQKWSNGKVGMMGVSYEGMLAEAFLNKGHNSLKSIAPLFSPFDLYRDLSNIGGLHSSRFFEAYGSFVNKLERGERLEGKHIPLLVRLFFNYIGTISPVSNNPEDLHYLQIALEEHKKNWLVDQEMRKAEYSDTPLDWLPDNATIDTLSSKQLINNIERKEIGVLSMSSWYDGAFIRSSITRFLSLKTPYKKLILGPWNHGGQANVSPFAGTSFACFNFAKELATFFDYHLKDVDNGYYTTAPVKYFTVGEEKWHEAIEWPPREYDEQKYFITPDMSLSTSNSSNREWCSFKLDFSVSTDSLSRWNLIAHMGSMDVLYRRLHQSNHKRLVFISDPLQHDTRLTGHALIHLAFKVNTTDAVIFSYLMDKNENQLTYVTEGHLRAVHRTEVEHSWSKYATLHRSFAQSDISPLIPNEEVQMNIHMMPASYLFRKGHQIVLAFSGSDTDNFDLKEIRHLLSDHIDIQIKQTYLSLPHCNNLK